MMGGFGGFYFDPPEEPTPEEEDRLMMQRLQRCREEDRRAELEEIQEQIEARVRSGQRP